MATPEKTIQIIGNESNSVTEIEASERTQTAAQQTTAEKVRAAEEGEANSLNPAAQRTNNEVATNDGAVIETLDTDFHGKPGVAEGENLSGSDRADYYEARSYGKTDAEEELDA